jgi:hypothetical protein
LVTNVQSHFVLRRPDGIWLGGRPVTLARGTPVQPASVPVACGQGLVLRYGTAAVGIRLVWGRKQDGLPAPAALIDDGNPYAAVRLTVEHRSPQPTAEAGAAFWVRVAGGLEDDAAFAQWRAGFDSLEPIAVETSAESLRIEVPGQDAPVSILAEAPYGRGRVELVPEPSRAVLELDGQEVGRVLLEAVEPVKSIARRMKELKPIEVPADGRVAWEAEAGLLVPSMTEAEDPGASGGRCVWQPEDANAGSPQGSANWPLTVARAGRYWLWGRVLATTGENDSFFVQLLGDDGTPLTPRGAWHAGHKGNWSWEPVRLNLGKQHEPFELPPGSFRLLITAREPGARLDQWMLSSDPQGPDD